MNRNSKILLIMPYFERPKMVLNALNSFRSIDYDNYIIAIIDDGSTINPIKEIIEKHYQDLLCKIVVYETNDTLENKSIRGSIHGSYMNKAIKEIESDIVVMMSDDDAVHRDYFKNLNAFYRDNPGIMYSYSHVILFDPAEQIPCESLAELNKNKQWRTNATTNLNWTTAINPFCRVDSTQVSWRRSCNVSDGVFFPEQQTKNLDASFYEQMFVRYKECVFNGFISCYKGMHSDQLTNRINNSQYLPKDSLRKNNYISICASFKNSSEHLKEWLQHHIELGVEHFYLYDEGSNDNYVEIIKPFYDLGFVTLKKLNSPETKKMIYYDFLQNYKFKNYWCIFIQTDEFISVDKEILNSSFDFRNHFRKFETKESFKIKSTEIDRFVCNPRMLNPNVFINTEKAGKSLGYSEAAIAQDNLFITKR